jgi:hypothetical protein
MKRSISLILGIVILISGCAMARHRSNIRDGMLITGLNRDAFLKEWGMPDRTSVISSDQFSTFTAGFHGSVGGAQYFSGTKPLDVWQYERWGITLVFDGLTLAAWKTDKSREQIKALSTGTNQ